MVKEKKFFKSKVSKMGKKKIINVPKDEHENFDYGDKVVVTED